MLTANPPLYCFKFNEKDQNQTILKRYTIPEWELCSVTRWRKEYRFKGAYVESSYKTELISSDNIDKICHKRLYTFDPDLERAEKMIEEYLYSCLAELQTKVNNAMKRITKWENRRIE